jgi:hypothetical protein
MSGIDVRIDTSELQGLVKQLEGLNARGISFATGRATNNVAFKIRDGWKEKAKQVFDRPTRFTENSVLVRKATRQNPFAKVFVRDEAGQSIAPEVYLQQQVLGGERRLKRSEVALRSLGLLPSGFRAVPGNGLRLDRSGNVPGRTMKAILDELSKAPNTGDRGLFALKASRGKLLPGIYRRRQKNARERFVTPLIIFVKTPRYTPRLEIFQYAREVMNREAVPEFRAAITAEIDRALAKAARAAGNGAS